MGVQILAAVPFLHALIHADCNSPTHECAVTLFSHGQVNASDVTVRVVLAPAPTALHKTFCAGPLVSRDEPLRSARGPPLSS